MSFRTYRKELDKKREEQGVINAINSMLSKLESKRDEYAEKAKNELKKGNKSQYSAYVALLKNAMFNIAQTKDMLANFTIAVDLREMQTLNRRFIKSLNSVMKDVYKTSKSIHVASSQKLFNKALYKQNFTAAELQQLLKDNNIAFESSVNSLSDISDADIRSVLESEIKKDAVDMDDMLSRLEEEFAVNAQPQKIAQTQGGNGNFSPPADIETADAPKTNEVKDEPYAEEKSVDEAMPVIAQVTEKKLNGMRNIEVMGAAFRPQRLKDYIGQPNAVATVSDPIKKSLLMEKALPHVLLCGSHGQGKTTLANIIANEMGGNFYNLSFTIKARDLQRTLRNIKKGDVIFIDEVHRLPTEIVESILYPAMEDFELHFTESNSRTTSNKTQKIEPFTFIGATTETGRLLKPFYSKFPINVTLCEYAVETIAAIVKNSFRVNGMSISDGLCFEIANRSRLSPRMANAHVEGIVSSAIVREAERRNIKGKGALSSPEKLAELKIEITEEDVKKYFARIGVDEKGLKEEERKILGVLIDMFGGGPVGQEVIAKALNMAANRVDQEYEPYLIKLGFVNIRSQGRCATDAAYEYMGRKKPNRKENSQASTTPPEEANAEVEDDLPVLECEIGETDEKSVGRFSALFSGEAEPNESGLDELFQGADKTYDSCAINRCVLKVGQRELYCDSKLERRFLSYLFKKGFIKDAKAEALELEYSSGAMSGKRYFPDFVLKLYDGRIAVTELKNLSSLGYHLNVDKYEALESFCRENGYLFAQIAKDYDENRYVSAAQIKQRKINTDLLQFINGKISQNGICTAAELEEFKYDVKDLICILLNERSIKNIDRTGGAPQLVSAND